MCCNNANILNEVLERPKDTEDDTCSLEYIDAKDDELTEEELLALGSCVARYFESSNSPESEESCLLDLDSILGGVDFSDDLAKPGDDFDLHLLLKSSKHPRNESRPLVEDVNAVIDLVASHKHYAALQTFFSIQWNRRYENIKKCVLSHKDRQIEQKNFASLFGELHFLCASDVSTEFSSVLCLETTELRRHYCTITDILGGTNSAIINKIKEVSDPEESPSMVFCSIADLPDQSRGKIRHCIGWAVSRKREKIRKEFTRHVNAEDVEMRSLTKKIFRKSSLFVP